MVPAPLVANGGVLAEPAVPEQQGAAESREAQILSAAEAAAGRRESSPPTSELSTGKINPQEPGWNKRPRLELQNQAGHHARLESVRSRRPSGVLQRTRLKM